jgi:hypothetical protein
MEEPDSLFSTPPVEELDTLLAADVFPFRSMVFFEAFWHGEAIGDGGDLEEALAAFRAVQSEQSDGICWSEACADPAAQPHLRRYASFEAYLDNADELETIAVTAAMIEAALQELV